MKFFETKDGKTVMWQKPNLPIIAAFVFWGLAYLATDKVSIISAILSAILFIYWGLLEVFWGVNNWRKLLGLAVIVTTLWSML